MDEQINDGGPVYPQGMSLRDWFAGQALANPKICGDGSAWEVDALTAYAAADAMLKEREGKEHNQ